MPRKLGQHFLRNREILETIAGLRSPRCRDIVEIGAGPGNLTELLCRSGLPVTAIEIDERFQRQLEKLPYPNLRVLREDVLELFGTGRFPSTSATAVFGNLPYYISKEIFRRLFSHDVVWSEAVVLVQKEVALRLTAPAGTGPCPAGSRAYGILSIFCQIFSEARLVRAVPASAFTPPPRVESAVVHLVRRMEPLVSRERLPGFSRLVKTAFVSRRKFILNNLIKLASKEHVLEILSRQDIYLRNRPENLTIEQYLRLYDDFLPYLE